MPNLINIKFFSSKVDVVFSLFGITGLQAEIEFPSDWHDEKKQAKIRIKFGFGELFIWFPWHKTVPDEGQCQGPTYGFIFFDDWLTISWGKPRGNYKNDPRISFRMPWAWIHKNTEILTSPEDHSYTYVLNSGEVQNRTATIQAKLMRWVRWWIPFKRAETYIRITFDNEVGEKAGSWKGGVIECSYIMLPGEEPVDALRRMERERKF